MSRALQAMAAALRGDEQARALGRDHGVSARPWAPPEGVDILSYSLGYADGRGYLQLCAAELAAGKWKVGDKWELPE
jgi:hypothetical protein